MGDGTEQNPYTHDDMLRLIKENGGKAKGLDLSDKWFGREIDLRQLNLDGILLESAHLEEANLVSAHLEGADLEGAHLERAKLRGAHLEEADLFGAHLEGADLEGAHLERANLWDAHLEGAFLFDAEFSPETTLEYIDWGNYILGEERSRSFSLASDTYRRLKQWYNNAGVYDTGAKFYYREKEANRKGARHWNDRAAGWLMWALFGHGEGWKRILFWIAGFILFFALIYLAIGTFIHNLGTLTPNTFLHSFYYSAVSFTALGYGNWAPEPTGWIKGLGAFEALLGISTMALLLVTFVRKWTR